MSQEDTAGEGEGVLEDKSNVIAIIAEILLLKFVERGQEKSVGDRIEYGELKLKEKEIESAVELARRIMEKAKLVKV